ncbi:MAG: NAD(+) synthase [Rikenellaceae bacterium]|nr:NAD(+) synthase [Rikenellaceae bacterium]
MDFGFIRVASAVPVVKVADCEYNIEGIYHHAVEAYRQGAAVIAFPELCVTGYTCGDLISDGLLVGKAERSVAGLLEKTSGLDIIIVVGVPVRYNAGLYNCAAVLHRGNILGIVPKTHIPNYEEFYERRWFTSGTALESGAETEYCGRRRIPFGTRLLFGEDGVKIAVEICEDLWVPSPPSSAHAMAGANIIANLSASDELVGKNDYLRSLISQQSARTVSCYLYASAGFGESTTDVVFAGNGIIAENGRIEVSAPRFGYGGSLTMFDTDFQSLNHLRGKLGTFGPEAASGSYRFIEVPIKRAVMPYKRFFDPRPFIPRSEEDKNVRCQEIFNIQVMGLAKRLAHTGSKNAVVGVSGGLDSTLALLVTAGAFDRLGLDRKGITAVTMPGFGTTGRTYGNAVNLIDALGATLREIDIRPVCEQHFRDIGLDPSDRGAAFENSQARERTQILMDIANMEGGLVVGTGDLSELALGWATYNGDHMSMYGVNSSVPKTLVKYLVEWAAETADFARAEKWLRDIVDTPISPELLPPDGHGGILQCTEELVGPYQLHDFFLYNFIRFGMRPAKIFHIARSAFEGKFADEEIKKWLAVFFRRFFSQQFKRSAMPDGPKVGTVSLSPRGDWRMPSDASGRIWIEEVENL